MLTLRPVLIVEMEHPESSSDFIYVIRRSIVISLVEILCVSKLNTDCWWRATEEISRNFFFVFLGEKILRSLNVKQRG